MAIKVECQRQLAAHFVDSPYIGSAQIYDEKETGLGKHRFFYLGYHDLFGVEIPAKGKRRGVEYQIWPREWTQRHLSRLDHRIREARAGKFLKVRHNMQLQKRATKSGRQLFEKPQWHNRPPHEAPSTEAGKLPIRGRKKKRTRRQLKI